MESPRFVPGDFTKLTGALILSFFSPPESHCSTAATGLTGDSSGNDKCWLGSKNREKPTV